MVGYVVQMLNVDDRPIIEADAEPTVELVVNVGDCWVFKKGRKNGCPVPGRASGCLVGI